MLVNMRQYFMMVLFNVYRYRLQGSNILNSAHD